LGNRLSRLKPVTEKPLEQLGLRDLREIMRRKVPAEAWKHFNGAAETKATFQRNPRAFRRYLFRQRIFHDVSEPDIAVELFGLTLPTPAVTAPVGSFSLIGKDTEREVAQGTERGDHDGYGQAGEDRR
jgi:lactate 2-monooxygenase